MVSGDVKETCLNWFYKIASIRELLPRLYLEIALIKSMSFLTQTEFDQTLIRLCHMIRGVGDPLIAAYVRCYLCRVAPTVTKETKYLEENFNDFLFVYHTVNKLDFYPDLLNMQQKYDRKLYILDFTRWPSN